MISGAEEGKNKDTVNNQTEAVVDPAGIQAKVSHVDLLTSPF
jgi:hypothetical protein